MKNKSYAVIISAVFVCLVAAESYGETVMHGGTTINMEFVEIGHAGNNADTTGYGSVNYDYRIGKYEVLYTQFLAAYTADNRINNDDDIYRWSDLGANAPVASVSGYEAMKFCNWLTTGDAYTGTYQFDIYGNLIVIDRATAIDAYGVIFVLPTEDEWYKAAYFKPDASGYSLYANGSDDSESVILGTPEGWNYRFPPMFPFSAWPTGYGAEEQNGTHDMMGNLEEWTESGIPSDDPQSLYMRGGGLRFYVEDLSSAYHDVRSPEDDTTNYGDVCFRVAIISEAISFSGLGVLTNSSTFSRAFGVSGNGYVTVGMTNGENGNEAFRWTQGGGMVGLGDLPGGTFNSSALGVSDNGSVIVVDGRSVNGSEGFRWTVSGGMVGLGDLPGGSFSSYTHGVSDDGSVVVGGSSGTNGDEAYRWTQSGGMVGLGDLTGGMIGLGDLPGGTTRSYAFAASDDGSVVVGVGKSANGTEAFRWTASGGMVGLGDLPGGSFFSEAYGVSSDGSVVVGKSRSANGEVAFVWDEVNGMRSLQSVLSYNGIDTTGWKLSWLFEVSDDGKTVVGQGRSPDRSFEAFIAVIADPVPGEIDLSVDSNPLNDEGSKGFGSQAVGTDKALTFTIINQTSGDFTRLSDLSITADGADASSFVVGSLSRTSLTNGQSTTFRVTFTPTSVAAHSAVIHILSNDKDESPFDINLTGTGLANADADPGSDAWETANGFSPTVDGDVMSLDSDGDGSPDIMEIYQGTERYPVGGFAAMALGGPENGNGFSEVSTSNGVLKVRYRRSTTQTAVTAQGIWLPDLMDNTWLYSGESSSGTVVTVSETVVSNGVGFEVVESASEVTSGDTVALFFTLELTPNE